MPDIFGWQDTARTYCRTSPDSIEALWRTLNYLAAAQLYLADNVLLRRPLKPSDVKPQPRGHWGVCPPVNLALSLIAPLQRLRPGQVTVVHGAGHAGPSALAYSYLTGWLGQRWPALSRGADGVHMLISGFPHDDWIGGEITALIPGHSYMGGQLGPALAHAAGTVLDRPDHLAVALIGDGECETGGTAAAWLGQRAFAATRRNGTVLPIVLVNGLRMGGPSLLGRMTADQRCAYFDGLGYSPVCIDGLDIHAARDLFARALSTTSPIGADARPPVVLITVPKGASGPRTVGTRTILGTSAVHKCPLTDPATNEVEFQALTHWLASYRPHELLSANGIPTTAVTPVLPANPAAAEKVQPPARQVLLHHAQARSFGSAISGVLQHWAAAHPRFRIFSPDELASNKILVETGGLPPDWVTELLNEELCHGWLQGYLESGGTGAFISYEAFAVVNLSLLHQYLLHRALAPSPAASMNYVLTSLGWNNTYTHQNPSLMSSMIETGSPRVRIYTPADPYRAAVVLDEMLRSQDRVNVMIADKHHRSTYPTATLRDEIVRGAAIWPQYSDGHDGDLVLAACGDIATRQLIVAADLVRAARPEIRIRFVQVAEVTALGDPLTRAHALTDQQFRDLFGDTEPVLVVTPGYPGAIHSLLWTRGGTSRFTIAGFKHPDRPTAPDELLRRCGIDGESLAKTALSLVDAPDFTGAGSRGRPGITTSVSGAHPNRRHQ